MVTSSSCAFEEEAIPRLLVIADSDANPEASSVMMGSSAITAAQLAMRCGSSCGEVTPPGMRKDHIEGAVQ
jgi:hypothetical protein